MATHDYSLANQSGSSFRTDLNNVLAAIVSNNSASSEPSTKYAFQYWADTSSGYLKIRNAANNAWVQLFKLDGTDIHFVNLSGSTNNTICTVTGADAIQGEANLTFDGTTLTVSSGTTDVAASFTSSDPNAWIQFRDDDTTDQAVMIGANDDSMMLRAGSNTRMTIAHNGKVGIGVDDPADLLHVSGASGVPGLIVENTSNSARESAIYLKGKHSNGTVRQLMLKYDSNDTFRIHTAGSIPIKLETADAVRVEVAEHLKINDGNLVIGTSGHGIDFSATSDGSGTTDSELFDEYEEGTFTPTSNATIASSGTDAYGNYTKIGRQVTVHIRIIFAGSQTSGTALEITGLPFSAGMPANLSNGATLGGFGYIGGSDMSNGAPQIHMQRNAAQTTFYDFTTALSIATFSGRELRMGWIYYTA